MSKTKKALMASVQLLILFFCITGMVVNIALAKSHYDALNLFSYYTIQSNLLVAIVIVFSLVRLAIRKPDSPGFALFKGGVTLWITVTGLVYHILLSRLFHFQGPMLYAIIALHYCTPAGMVLNWLLFEEKSRYQWKYSFHWLSYPLLYLVVSLIRGAWDGFYPYWFINPVLPYPEGTGSYGNLLLMVGGLSALFWVLGILMIAIDKFLGKNIQY